MCRKSKQNIFCSITFSKNVSVFQISQKTMVQQTGHRWQYDACRKDVICFPVNWGKNTRTHLEYLILAALPWHVPLYFFPAAEKFSYKTNEVLQCFVACHCPPPSWWNFMLVDMSLSLLPSIFTDFLLAASFSTLKILHPDAEASDFATGWLSFFLSSDSC